MPVLYDDASSEQHNAPFTYTGGDPLTLSCWVFVDTASHSGTAMAVTDTAGDVNYVSIGVVLTLFPLISLHDGTESTRSGPTNIVINTWHHLAGVVTSVTDYVCYVDAAVSATGTTSRSPAGVDTYSIGANASATPFSHFSGRVFWPAIYNTNLSAFEILMLSKGAYPPTIRRDALVRFPRMLFDEDRDLITGVALTPVNTPGFSNDRPFQTQFVSGRGRNRSRARMSFA